MIPAMAIFKVLFILYIAIVIAIADNFKCENTNSTVSTVLDLLLHVRLRLRCGHVSVIVGIFLYNLKSPMNRQDEIRFHIVVIRT